LTLLSKCIRNKNRKKTDRLNRRLDWKVEIEKYNENKKLIKEEWIYRSVEEGSEIDILEK